MIICIMIEICFILWIIMDLIDLFSNRDRKIVDYLGKFLVALGTITVILAIVNRNSALSWFNNHPSFWILDVISIIVCFVLQIILFVKKD